jgi:sugar lactone lactonase YvrE
VRIVTRTSFVLLALAISLPAVRARADGLSLRFSISVYQDEKEGALQSPEGVACTDTALFVADTANARIVKYALQNGAPVTSTAMKLEQLKQPTELQLDGKGNLLVLDRRARKIGRVDPQAAFAGWVEVKGAEGVVPVAFKVGAADGMVLLDISARRVLVLDASGTVTRQVPLPQGEFTDVAVDAEGMIYAVDSTASVVWSAAKDAAGFKPLTRSLKDVLPFPTYLAPTNRGVILVVDQHGHGVVLVGNDGSYMGRQLAPGFNEGVLYYPGQLCMNEKGQVFVADRYNNRVQVFETQR